MENLAHSASFHSREKSAPSNPGTKHLERQAQPGAAIGGRPLQCAGQLAGAFPTIAVFVEALAFAVALTGCFALGSAALRLFLAMIYESLEVVLCAVLTESRHRLSHKQSFGLHRCTMQAIPSREGRDDAAAPACTMALSSRPLTRGHRGSAIRNLSTLRTIHVRN